MSRLHEMKSKGLDKTYPMYSRSSFFGFDKTMQDVVNDIKDKARISTHAPRNKTRVKTFKATMRV